MQKKILLFSAISGAIAVTLGAMGAHFLKSRIATGQLTPEHLQSFETAARYQMYHTLALITLVIVGEKFKLKLLNITGILFMIGIILFSGSIYLLSTRTLLGIESWTWLGPITPIGGLAFISGWIIFFISIFKIKQ